MAIPESRRLDFSEVELIDIGPLVAGTDDEGVVNAIRSACTNTGFFYIANHGIARELVRALHDQAALFFSLPWEQRMAVRMGPSIRGYLPLGFRSEETLTSATKLSGQSGINLQEGFWMGYDRPEDPECPFDGPNVWPIECPELKPAMEAYFKAAQALAVTLRRAFSLALGLEPTRLDKLFEHEQSRLKLNHYPIQEDPTSVNEIGVVPHSDTGAYTILWQDDNGGLEIENKSGEWVGVPPIPDTFVINIGNTMQMMTGGCFSSTPHRVINRRAADRYSIPFFANPGHHVTIEPLLASDDGTFEPFSFGEYQRKEYRGIYPVAFGN
ncbi:MAG: hypothetical protein CMO26_21435 [Thiotrichales bacterium]|mgnify:CR=1 FL=1|nr:hypothetical protein [Thiotrichales bacterium]